MVEVQRRQGQRQEQGSQKHSTGYDGQIAFQVRPPLPPCWISKTKHKFFKTTGGKKQQQ